MGPSLRDVAEAAGVSIATVSNVLNHPDRVTPATTGRVVSVIEQIGFVRNEAARQLRVGHNPAIGLIVLDISNPFFTDMAMGVEDRLAAAGRFMLLAGSARSQAREDSSLELFERLRVSGVILSPISVDRRRVQRLLDLDIKVVLVDRASDDGFVPSVSIDNVAGGRMAAEHLIEIDRRRIAFAGGPRSLEQVADRLTGIERVVARTAGAQLIEFPTDALTVEQGRTVGATIAALGSGHRPDAVFCANDLLAFGVLQAFRAAKIKVPDDIALIGYDDIEFARFLEVPLTSVRQPSRELGFRAADLLLAESVDQLEERNFILAPEVVRRASTGCGPG